MLEQRIEAFVPRNDVEEGVLVFGGQSAQVVGNVEVQGILTRRIQLDVIRPIPEALDSHCKLSRELGVVGAEEDPDLEVRLLQQQPLKKRGF
ncbi:hypothetical protein D3C80_1917770 [compost metagenome]